MDFVLAGFNQFESIRRYFFDAVQEGRPRRQFTVAADLTLVRKYKIPLQDLPLLCRKVLEAGTDAEITMFTETDMARYSAERQAVADDVAAKRRTHRFHPRRPDAAAPAPEK